MKFIHLSDLHIGKHLYHYNMKEDQEHIYWKGSIGISTAKGSHMKCRKIVVS